MIIDRNWLTWCIETRSLRCLFFSLRSFYRIQWRGFPNTKATEQWLNVTVALASSDAQHKVQYSRDNKNPLENLKSAASVSVVWVGQTRRSTSNDHRLLCISVLFVHLFAFSYCRVSRIVNSRWFLECEFCRLAISWRATVRTGERWFLAPFHELSRTILWVDFVSISWASLGVIILCVSRKFKKSG